jgi:hypothetical protein
MPYQPTPRDQLYLADLGLQLASGAAFLPSAAAGACETL